MFTKTDFITKVAPELKKSLKKKNIHSLPRIIKISVNVGAGKLVNKDKKVLDEITENLKLITGQKPIITKARKAISNFKIREGMPLGASVTLRGQRMYDFLNKLINAILPRMRDFKGISIKSFDGKGNISVGIDEHTVFPEINPDDIVTIHGLQININTTAETDEEAYQLLKTYGFPFKKTNA